MLNEEFILITRLLDAIKEKDTEITDLCKKIIDMQEREMTNLCKKLTTMINEKG